MAQTWAHIYFKPSRTTRCARAPPQTLSTRFDDGYPYESCETAADFIETAKGFDGQWSER